MDRERWKKQGCNNLRRQQIVGQPYPDANRLVHEAEREFGFTYFDYWSSAKRMNLQKNGVVKRA